MNRVLEKGRRVYGKKRAESTTRKNCAFCSYTRIKKHLCATFPFLYWKVVANENPYMDGNLMLVPKRHVESLLELTDIECKEWYTAVSEVQSCLSSLFHTTSFNLSLNLGVFSGRSIKHLHWQIIPRTHNHKLNAINIFSDLFVVSISATDLVKMVARYHRALH